MPKPEEVVAPKDRWEIKEVLYTGKNHSGSSWSVAKGIYEEGEVIAIRWDGDDPNDKGFPTSRYGTPVWFVLPEPVGLAVVMAVQALKVMRVV